MGVSELTIRRRIKDGRIAFRMVGGKYYVNRHGQPPAVPEGPQKTAGGRQARDRSASAERTARQDERVALESILPHYARLAEQAGRAALLEQRVAELSQECRTLRESVIALTGRNGWLESKLDERNTEVRLLTDQTTRPGFWRRLLRIHGDASGR
jgi:hypothetical protein